MATTVGVVGCGAISGVYLENLRRFAETEVVALADLDEAKAKQQAERYGIERTLSPSALVRAEDIDLILNLTVPRAHAEVALSAVEAGKHVYNEKPLTADFGDTKTLMSKAASRGVMVGCAPDTVLGAGCQTCRELVDGGDLGEIVGFNAFMQCAGHESWHPSPAFYYELGGGPLFDMGPYYLTCLVQLLGRIRSVGGLAKTTFPTRTATSKVSEGTVIPVQVPTHLVTIIEFECGAIGQFTSSFDTMAGTELPHIEVYGTRATLRVPDPNGFGGPVLVRRVGSDDWSEVPVGRAYQENSRGIGVLDMALALNEGREPRASGGVAAHVCEVMHLAHQAADDGHTHRTTTVVERPSPMPWEGLECR